MKRKAYTITGQSFTKPGVLPDGFTVEETEAEDPKSGAWDSIVQPQGVRLEVRPSRWERGVEFYAIHDRRPGNPNGVTVSLDSARQVRDCLNAILGAGPKTERVLVYKHDLDNDWRWFETSPGLFTYARSRTEAYENASKGEKLCTNRTIEDVQADYNDDAVVLEVIA